MSSIIKEVHSDFPTEIYPITKLWIQEKVEGEKEREEQGKEEASIEKQSMIEREQLLEEARKEAAFIINQGRHQVEQWQQEANEKIQREAQEFEQECKRLRQIAYEEKQHNLKQQETQIIKVISELLTYLVGSETQYSENWIRYFVKSVIEKEGLQEELTIRISQEHYERIELEKQQIKKHQKCKMRWEVDSTLDNDQCVIDTAQGSISYNVKNGLQRVINDLHILLSKDGERT